MAEGLETTAPRPLEALRAGSSHPAPAIQGAALLGLLAAIYGRTAAVLWATWTTNDNYSHGPLVPVAALGMVWSMRARLRDTPVRPDARGIGLVAAACLLEVAGLRADVFALQGYSLILMLYGLALVFLGGAWTRRLTFPIAYLAFMLTFPPVVIQQLSYALKEIAVRLATHAAEALGVTFQRRGMTVYLASGALRVDNPCSGLRSLLALLATGAAFAFFQPGAWWRRACLVAAAIPIAVASNAIRLTALLLVGHYAGVAVATGPFHDGSGYMVYVLAILGLFAVRAALGGAAPRPAAAGAKGDRP